MSASPSALVNTAPTRALPRVLGPFSCLCCRYDNSQKGRCGSRRNSRCGRPHGMWCRRVFRHHLMVRPGKPAVRLRRPEYGGEPGYRPGGDFLPRQRPPERDRTARGRHATDAQGHGNAGRPVQAVQAFPEAVPELVLPPHSAGSLTLRMRKPPRTVGGAFLRAGRGQARARFRAVTPPIGGTQRRSTHPSIRTW